MITPGVMSAHYSIEYRTHFTHMHQTVIGFIGATEQLLFVQAGTLACYFYPKSNEMMADIKFAVPGTDGYEITLGDIVVIFSFLTGVHYNIENILVSFCKAKDKGYALGCTLPYIQFFIMMYASSYSALFKDYPAYFLVLNGFYLTWITAIFNLCSTSSSKYNWLFLEPIVYLSMLYCEHA